MRLPRGMLQGCSCGGSVLNVLSAVWIGTMAGCFEGRLWGISILSPRSCGVAEGAADGIGDTAATFLGVPEVSVPLDAAIDRGLSSVQKAGTKYLDDKIDASGRGHGVRYLAPSGGGMRMSGVPTHSGGAMRLSGQGHGKAGHCGCGIRQSGAGITAAHTFPAYPLEHGQTP